MTLLTGLTGLAGLTGPQDEAVAAPLQPTAGDRVALGALGFGEVVAVLKRRRGLVVALDDGAVIAVPL